MGHWSFHVSADTFLTDLFTVSVPPRPPVFFIINIIFLQLFRARNGWFLVPIIAPFIGTIIGVMIYQLMVGFHVEGEARDRKKMQEEEENVRLTSVNTNNTSEEK